jgi:hypothetical protein
MEKFHDRCQANRTRAAGARIAVAKYEQRGAQAFAAATQEIASDFRNWFKCGSTLPRKFFFDEDEIVAD